MTKAIKEEKTVEEAVAKCDGDKRPPRVSESTAAGSAGEDDFFPEAQDNGAPGKNPNTNDDDDDDDAGSEDGNADDGDLDESKR